MSIVLAIILILVCAALAFFVLIQNPKGGGLSGGYGTVGTQMMGVQNSTDTVEKGTWILASVMALLCILSVAFGDRKAGTGKTEKSRSEKAVKNAPIAAPPVTAPSTATMPASAPATGTPASAPAAPANAPTTAVTPATAPAATTTAK
jgi:preprotein translocase subunit SecG